MFRTRCARVSAVAVGLLLISATVFAEPFTIRAGTISYSRSNEATFDLTFDPLVFGFDSSAAGEFGDSGSESWNPPHACFPCTSGSTMNLSLSEHFTIFDPPGASVGGILREDNISFDIDGLQFVIAAGGIIVPVLNPGAAVWSSFVPFTFRGNVGGEHAGDSLGMELAGRGMARVLFENGNWFATEYRFEDPASTPEPGTLFLFATGAGLVARRMRRA
jgi:hypothetical protein